MDVIKDRFHFDDEEEEGDAEEDAEEDEDEREEDEDKRDEESKGDDERSRNACLLFCSRRMPPPTSLLVELALVSTWLASSIQLDVRAPLSNRRESDKRAVARRTRELKPAETLLLLASRLVLRLLRRMFCRQSSTAPCRGDVTNTRRRSNRHERASFTCRGNGRPPRKKKKEMHSISEDFLFSFSPPFFLPFRVLLSSLYSLRKLFDCAHEEKKNVCPRPLLRNIIQYFSPSRPSTGLLAT